MEAQSPRTVSEAETEKARKSREKAAVVAEEAEEERRRPWRKAALTAVQLHELQMQAAAYRYLAAGLPVPLHLVVPIWNSLAFSSWSHYLAMLHQHSSSRLSHQGFNHRDMMEPEPTRCRRTDGKKWRCSNDVVPFQKYCERHMHRGRKRSRKLVESSQTALSAPTVSIKQENNDDLDNPMIQNLQHTATASSSKAPIVTIALYTDSGSRKDSNNIAGDKLSSPSYVISASTNKSVSHGSESGGHMGRDNKEESNRSPKDDYVMKLSNMSTGVRGVPGMDFYPKSVLQALGRGQTKPRPGSHQETSGKRWRSGEDVLSGQRCSPEFLRRGSETSDPAPDFAKFLDNSKMNGNSLGQSDMKARSRYLNNNHMVKWSNINVGGCIVPRMHFSPDSVLQDRGGLPFHRSKTEHEPGRCRRTDGKKWRCSKDVLPGQKYCPKHMHRGVKKTNAAPIACALTTTAGSSSCKDAIDNREENARLSVFVPENPLFESCEDKNTSSSSSDTTITDTALKGEDNDDSSLVSGV